MRKYEVRPKVVKNFIYDLIFIGKQTWFLDSAVRRLLFEAGDEHLTTCETVTAEKKKNITNQKQEGMQSQYIQLWVVKQKINWHW